MSASAYGYAVIGLWVTGKQMKAACKVPSVQERGCKHSIIDPGPGVFCRQCGAPWMVTREQEPKEPEELVAPFELTGNTDALDFVVHETKYYAGTGDINEGAETPSKCVLPSDQDLYEYRERLKAAMEPLGLWKDERFGLWIVGCCNY